MLERMVFFAPSREKLILSIQSIYVYVFVMIQ